jgi:DNA processing protein
VESPEWSGSLITANLAADQGRNLYAVPGPIDRPSSGGCHRLIQQGAKLVMTANDIFEDMGILTLSNEETAPEPGKALKTARPALSGEETKVLECVETFDTALNDIFERSGMETSEVIANLMRLEIKGFVKQLPGRHYARLS